MKLELAKIQLPQKDLRASIDEESLDELSASLRDVGQLQPIGVLPLDNGTFEVVFGARRTRAARLLGWTEIDGVIVEENNATPAAAKKLIENVQRENLTPIEEGYGLLELIGEAEADVRILQRQTGKSRGWIQDRLKLVTLPPDIQGAVQSGLLSMAAAFHLGQITNEAIRSQYVTSAIENGCTADMAKLWAAQASFAETGLVPHGMTEDQIQNALEHSPSAEMMFMCFICNDSKRGRDVISVITCANCHTKIGDARREN